MSLKQIKNAKTLGALARALRDAARDLPSDVNKIKQDTAKYAARRLVYETPVDTSLALSNWQVGLSVVNPTYGLLISKVKADRPSQFQHLPHTAQHSFRSHVQNIR